MTTLNQFIADADCKYETDGVVIRSNEESFEAEREKPMYTIAYKFDNEWFPSEVTHITYSINQSGLLVPSVNFRQVKINGKN